MENGMQIGQDVKVTVDEWSLFGSIGQIVEVTTVNGFDRYGIEIGDDVVILTASEFIPFDTFS